MGGEWYRPAWISSRAVEWPTIARMDEHEPQSNWLWWLVLIVALIGLGFYLRGLSWTRWL
jgi:hypothetical protein